jgi:2-dehydropantoate 2-reductase
VLLICRQAHADAITENGGIRLRSATGDYFARLRAATKLTAGDLSEDACVFITVKSYDTDECVKILAAVAPKDTPVVCFQNGIANEDKVAEKFERVYGGICWMTCSMIQAGQASFRQHGRIVVGKHPKGADPLAKNLAEAFDDAGCQATASRSIVCDRWLKLAVNTQSTFNAIIDSRDHDANEFFDLKVRILEETRDVLKAHKARPKSCDGKDLSINEAIAELKRPRALRTSSGMKVNNSTWQNLYLKRPLLENEFIHLPIIELGREYKIPAPYNEVALEAVTKCHVDEVGPNTLRLSDILTAVEKRKQ